MITIQFKSVVKSATELFSFDSRNVIDARDVLEFVKNNDAQVAESRWKDSDTSWPESDREGRKVFVLTPTKDGYLNPLEEMVIVIG